MVAIGNVTNGGGNKFDNYSIPNPTFDWIGANHFDLVLIGFTTFRWLLAMPGLIFNAALLLVFYRNKKLRGTCPLLLAIGSGCDFVYLSSFTIPFLLAISGTNFAPLWLCYLLQFLPNIGLFSSVWIVFFVGLDRLISILFPFWYARMEQSHVYILGMLSVTFGYSLYVMRIAMDASLFDYPNRAVLCANGDIFGISGMSTMLLRNGLVINGAALCCYGFAWIALRRFQRRVGEGVEANKHKIFKSLAAIMILVVGSYFLACVYRMLANSSPDQFFLVHISPCLSALFTVLAASSNPPLLFLFSNDYRRAFRHQFGHWPLLGPLLGRNYEENSTGIQQMMMVRTIGDIHMTRLAFSRANIPDAGGNGHSTFQQTILE